jgi:uncharacterized membrane protein
MKKFIPYIYTLLFMGAAGNVSASATMEMNSVSTAMLVFMVSALIALLITYSMWKFNELTKKKSY